MAMTAGTAALALTMPASAASAASADASDVSGDATALACPTTWSPNPDWYDPTSGSVKEPTAPLRPGPYADCGTRETLQQGWTMVIYCYYKNDYDKTWYYVSAYPNWTRGWIYSGNVRLEGIVWPC
ncbi:predicted protein [Streptomyces viridochromogenes DSM 40736]|uniref:Predicted protein n=1 Tax=Streptomyces viridochromogenes (strain DSM 40736 / JCM 4977 / BCRC 1201 / Tue 494) TaxID=591159 RepID=D9X1V8_STRVT|nr:hypothetical protein [Streptomyces viridochromogenes]EFL29530.1 predicted protein [Streptomyces viridochromogenes DSM 40736]